MATSLPTSKKKKSPKSSPKQFNVAVVGGGIAGLVLTIGLLEQSVPVTLYESAARFGEIGAGVSFGPNARQAMALISPKIKAGFDKAATMNKSPNKQKIYFTVSVGDARRGDADGVVREEKEKKKGSGGGGSKPGKVKVGEPLFEIPHHDLNPLGGVHRAHFIDEMAKLIPEHVPRFRKRLIDVGQVEHGTGLGNVVLYFADGSTATHSVVIGCDGIKSRTRELVLGIDDPAARAVFSGKYAYRGLIPMNEAITLIGEERAVNSQMYLGYHGHLLTFPIAKGTIMNVVAFSSRASWDDPNWVVPTTKEDMLADYTGWGPTVTTIVKAMKNLDIWALFNHPPAHTYYKGRVCLIGDAAHATTPHQGAGAGMAIEDAYILSHLMGEVESIQDIPRVFKAYDAVRRPRSQKLVETSREAGQLYNFEFLKDNLDEIEENMLRRLWWIWDIDLKAEADKARIIFREEKARL